MTMLFRLFSRFLAQSMALYWRVIFNDGKFTAVNIKQRFILLLLFPIFFIWQCINWFGLFLDELFFRGYKQVEIRSPVFILGIPRSGTTFLHRLFSEDKQFTTLSTWECLFAPSITQRKFFQVLAAIDHKLGSKLHRLSNSILESGSRKLNEIHGVTLEAAEEDYMLLLPVLAAFILIVPFPKESAFWDLAFFDTNIDQRKKKDLLNFYHSCLQRHIYAQKEDRVLLSKNASFLSWQQDLARQFPDARFVLCTRAPEEALGSQLSAIKPGISFFNTDERLYQEAFIKVFEHNYQLVYQLLDSNNRQVIFPVKLSDLKDSLFSTVMDIYRQFDLTLSHDFKEKLRLSDKNSKTYQSRHEYVTPGQSLGNEALEKLNHYYHAIIVSGF